MAGIWAQVALVFALALVASVIAHRYRFSTALVEIVVGMVAGSALGALGYYGAFSVQEPWVKAFAGIGAILLTFLAGAELDPDVFKMKWREAAAIGAASFLLPAIGCWAAAHYLLDWESAPALLAGIALAATSVAVVYTVMMEYGFNRVEYGKTILAACFITDLGTVITLGLVFAPFTWKTLAFVLALGGAFVGLPKITPRAYAIFGGKPSEFEAKFLLFCLMGLGALAVWAGSEAVLPAYLIGMALAGSVGRDAALVKRLRAITIGLLTPFYFVRAGYFVSIPTVLMAPFGVVALLIVEIGAKIVSVYPVARAFNAPHKDAMYTTLLMASGLTFGTISALFGLSNKIIDDAQYSTLVAAIIGTALLPTLIANKFYLPRHLLPKDEAALHTPAHQAEVEEALEDSEIRS
ncbi:cation:proton antiporter [Methylocystis sp. Sn-Cys]|uniref:cation:proton antiporter n=1 Tax=Methylocystis sp. Sn-Cys TaxID=1701263 RepID=UPI001923ACF5|nr:cation:proton antiporter [Methylocystis sp. Sn-Cys]MBL1257762.1 cation:proton antiporter [Methylocystis sp. Sn-Cys]